MMLEYTYPPLSGPNRNQNRTWSRYSQGPQISPSLTIYPLPLYTSVFFIITFISRGECGRNRGKWSIFEPFFYHLLIKGKTLIYICRLSFQLNFLTGIYISIAFLLFIFFFFFPSSMLGYFALHFWWFFLPHPFSGNF